MGGPAFTLAGVDGCKGGWIVVAADRKLSSLTVGVFPTVSTVLAAYPELHVMAEDIPIGLLDTEPGERSCDREARAVLMARRSSVFPAPRRFLLGVTPYSKANALSKEQAGRGLSAQTYNIMDKVREVDDVVRVTGQGTVREVHPEVCFWAMNRKRPMTHYKKTPQGRLERRLLLATHLEEDLVQASEAQAPRRGIAGLDDLYDALAALWTARRILEGQSERLPRGLVQRDSLGLAMEINY
ncbi:MAG: DUF429 domain-containing protein [Chloroflexi bacterium]|nr:DUF429 domain-containing protein [Chloroflexota bacterium]